ncbi:HNH endonuclease [Pseudomonas putida]|nr:HNH endonuclease [Pseudomonas putida]
MVIKAVSRARLDGALQEFDLELREKREWQDWESNVAHRLAINIAGARYPAKKIVSLATGIPANQFRGGYPVKRLLEKLGLTVIELEHGDNRPVLQFTAGAVYDRVTEINEPFGGSHQNGISVSRSHLAIFIFSGESGKQYGYTDGWIDDVYHYTGHGQHGHMSLSGGNEAIAQHAEKGRALHLFESLGKSKGYRYEGEFSCADIVEQTLPDAKGEDRKALVFRLVPVGHAAKSETGEEDAINLSDSLDEARIAALEACKPATDTMSQSAPRRLYQRSRTVAHYVLMRASGKCESCDKPAPFLKRDGTPYLEPHHVNRLSDGGLDHPRFVGAVCPTCHREIHSGANGTAVNDLLKLKLDYLEG